MTSSKLILVIVSILSLSACMTGRDTSGTSSMGSAGSSGNTEASGNYVFGGNAGDWTRPAGDSNSSSGTGSDQSR
jgi:hypothetical protein